MSSSPIRSAIRARTREDIVAEWLRKTENTPRKQQREEYLLRRKRQRQTEGIREIASADSALELVRLWAEGRGEPLASLYPAAPEGVSKHNALKPDSDALMPLRLLALSAMMGKPVLKVLPWRVALNAAETMTRRDVTFMSLPRAMHGDAAYLLVSGAPVDYADAKMEEFAFTPGSARLECGYTAAELRFGVNPDHRMQRYAYPEIRDAH